MVTGLLWAACLWLLAGVPVAESRATVDFVAGFDLDRLPTTAWVAAAALFVYLIGSLLVVRMSPFVWLSSRLRPSVDRNLSRLEEGGELESHFPRVLRRALNHEWLWSRRNALRAWANPSFRFQTVDGWLRNEFQGMVADGRVPVMRSFRARGCEAPSGFEAFYSAESIREHREIEEIWFTLSDEFVTQVKQEQSAVEVRIQMRFPEVYAEIDRLKVEAELRMSIFWPLSLLCLLMAVAWSPFTLLGLIIPPLLLRDGFKRSHEASEKTWNALVAGEVTTPTLDNMASVKDVECRDFGARRW
jgi:hypothetical protein